jgi:hypothetical protein
VIVLVGDGFGVADRLQAASAHAVNSVKRNGFNFVLIGNGIQGCYGEKGILIADFALRNSKGVISIANQTLGRGGCPGHMARASFSGVASQSKIAIG